MNYYLFKLSFDTAVHFGTQDSALSLYSSENHFYADTLFSALCHAALSLQGNKGLEELCNQAKSGELLLSDSMPWRKSILYLPKPCVSSKSKQDLPASQRKAVKKLTWIPLLSFSAFSESVHGGKFYDIDSAKAIIGTKNEVSKANVTDSESSLPYQLGLYHYDCNCGLWIIIGCKTTAQYTNISKLLNGLGLTGIGGKTSSGYGKFHVSDCIYINDVPNSEAKWLLNALENDSAPRQFLLSTSLPNETDLIELLPEAEYQLVRRAGFIQSSRYKKRTQYFLSAGSILPRRFSSMLYTVGESEGHPVFRFSGPILLGVNL